MIVEFPNLPLLFLGFRSHAPLDVYRIDIAHLSRQEYDLVMSRYGNIILGGDLLFPYKIAEDAGGLRVLVYQQGTIRFENTELFWEALQAKKDVYLLCVAEQDLPELQRIMSGKSRSLYVYVLDADTSIILQ